MLVVLKGNLILICASSGKPSMRQSEKNQGKYDFFPDVKIPTFTRHIGTSGEVGEEVKRK